MAEEPCYLCQRLRRRLMAALAVGVLGLIIAAAGLIRFASTIPETVADSETPTDAIVVLTGGSARLGTGLQLLAEDKAERVFVTGVHPSVARAEFLAIAGVGDAEFTQRIETGHSAGDTQGNAHETARWMHDHGYRSLRLVTSNYHMPRSILEFSRAMPEVRIIPHPVFSPTVRSDDWWRFPGTAMLIISEYAKFIVAWVSHHGGVKEPLAGSGTP